MKGDKMDITMDKKMSEIIKALPPKAGRAVLEEYRNSIPFVVKDAIDEFYAAMNGLKDRQSVDSLREAMTMLKAACEANPKFQDVYEAAKREAKNSLADAVANEGMTLFDD
jgi:hypothetical protein